VDETPQARQQRLLGELAKTAKRLAQLQNRLPSFGGEPGFKRDKPDRETWKYVSPRSARKGIRRGPKVVK
jgi:hypothetical protein